MKLSELKQQIKNITDEKASNPNYEQDLEDIINRAYKTVWNDRPWEFTLKTAFLDIVPDLNYERTTVTANITNFSRSVVFSAAIYSLTENNWNMQYIELQGREYRIVKIVSNTTIRLEEPFRGTTDTADTTWVLKHKDYVLPADLVDIVSLGHSDAPIVGGERRIIPYINHLAYDRDSYERNRVSTYADLYTRTPAISIPSAGVIGDLVGYTASAGNLTAGHKYEFCWCFSKGETLGSLSEPRVLTVNSAEVPCIPFQLLTHDRTVAAAPTFSSLTDQYMNPFEGYTKRIFVNVNYRHVTHTEDNTTYQPGRIGTPKWVEVTQGIGTTADKNDHLPLVLTDEQSTVVIAYTKQLSPDNKPYLEVDGSHFLVRPYPRIDAWDAKYDRAMVTVSVGQEVEAPEIYFRQLELKYRYKPPTLTSPADSPKCPYEVHELIVTKALEDWYIKKTNANLAELYRNRYLQQRASLEKKYVEYEDHAIYRRNQFGRQKPLAFTNVRVRN